MTKAACLLPAALLGTNLSSLLRSYPEAFGRTGATAVAVAAEKEPPVRPCIDAEDCGTRDYDGAPRAGNPYCANPCVWHDGSRKLGAPSGVCGGS